MKRHICILISLLGLVGTTAFAATSSNNDVNQPHRLPVLVNVDSHGTVTDVDPAYELRPSLTRALRDTVQKMITKPAMNKGKPVRSQFVINFNMVTVAKKEGGYEAQFKYVSSKSLPSGAWHWSHTADHRLALTDARAQILPMSRTEPALPNEPQGSGTPPSMDPGR